MEDFRRLKNTAWASQDSVRITQAARSRMGAQKMIALVFRVQVAASTGSSKEKGRGGWVIKSFNGETVSRETLSDKRED